MGKTTAYSDKENQLLISDLKSNNGIITEENINSLEQLWEGLTGAKRKPYPLFRQTIALARKEGIEFCIKSVPKRDTSNWKKRSKAPSKNSSKNRVKEQITFIFMDECKKISQKATWRILSLLQETIQENIELKEEIRNLRPYKQIAETSYRKELSMRGGG